LCSLELDCPEAQPGLVYLDEARRDAATALPPGGFWLAEALARGAGSLIEAHEAFLAALSQGSHLALFAAAIDTERGVPTGNFPHNATHAGLLSAAVALASRAAAEGRRIAPVAERLGGGSGRR
jgi:hypothetical protein